MVMSNLETGPSNRHAVTLLRWPLLMQVSELLYSCLLGSGLSPPAHFTVGTERSSDGNNFCSQLLSWIWTGDLMTKYPVSLTGLRVALLGTAVQHGAG